MAIYIHRLSCELGQLLATAAAFSGAVSLSWLLELRKLWEGIWGHDCASATNMSCHRNLRTHLRGTVLFQLESLFDPHSQVYVCCDTSEQFLFVCLSVWLSIFPSSVG